MRVFLLVEEGNIHYIMPNEYAKLIDVYTPLHSSETRGVWYTVDEKDFY
ncbi:MAG: hypothetical protein MK086_14350 [Flavobacteriales bacterium]|nr:hypothetical protein [Flavobacteriales bacterium]